MDIFSQVLTRLRQGEVLLVSTYGGGALLRAAAAVGAAPLVDALLDVGVSVAEADEHLTTALHEAAAAGHADVCRLLCEAGADPKTRDNHALDDSLERARFGSHIAALQVMDPTVSDLDICLLYTSPSPRDS